MVRLSIKRMEMEKERETEEKEREIFHIYESPFLFVFNLKAF